MKQIGLRDAHNEFKNFLKDKKHSTSTIVAYGKDIEQLVGFLEDLEKNQVHEVQRDDLQAFLAKLGKEGYTPKSLSRKINSTRTFYRFLKVNEFVTDDPSLLIEHPKYELTPPLNIEHFVMQPEMIPECLLLSSFCSKLASELVNWQP